MRAQRLLSVMWKLFSSSDGTAGECLLDVATGSCAGHEKTLPLLFSDGGNVTYYFERDKLYRADNSKGTQEVIGSPFQVGPQAAIMSPDAHLLAYVRSDGDTKSLIVRDLASGAEHVLVPCLSRINNTRLPRAYAFSPDSKAIFIAYGGKIHRIEVADGSDRVVPIAINAKVDLGPLVYNRFRVTDDPLSVKYTRSANTSPDGHHVVFTALNRIYVEDLAKGKPVELSPQPLAQFQPIYSPDGKWIAYVTWSDRTGGALCRVSANGGEPQQLTTDVGQYQRPAWSPDGNWIAVVRGERKFLDRDQPGEGQLELVPSAGGPVRVIDENVVMRNFVAFSADGHSVIYMPEYKPDRNVPPAQRDRTPLLVEKDLTRGTMQLLAVGGGGSENVPDLPIS